MYSRNIGIYDKVNPEIKVSGKTPPKILQNKYNTAIPVKSFGDGFAYEHFNSLGNSSKVDKIFDESEVQTDTYNEMITVNQNSERVGASETRNDDSYESNSDIKSTNDKHIISTFSEKSSGILGDIINLGSLLDGDLFIIGIAVAMLLLSNNETNDKLTPLALLAILFL